MSSSSLVKAIKIGLFASLLTPVVVSKDFYFLFVGPKSLYFMAIVEVVFFLWSILIWKWKQYRPSFKNPVIIAVLAFLAISFVSAIFGANFSVSFWSKFERMGGVLMIGHLAALVVVASSVLRGKDWNWLFGGSVVVASVVAVEAIFDTSTAASGGGFLGNESFWGAYVLFNIFLAFYLFFSKEWRGSKNLKIFTAAMFFLLVFCLLVETAPFWLNLKIFHPNPTGPYLIPSGGIFHDIFAGRARAAKISFIFGLSFIGILWLATRNNIKIKRAGLGILAVLVIGGISAIVMSTLQGNAINRMMEKEFSEGTIYGRVAVWKIAWQGFTERPLLGWGPENFDLVFTKYYNPCFGTEKCAGAIWYDQAHNIIFDTLVTTGIIGLISYLAILGAALWVLWKKYRAGILEFAAAGVFTGMLAAYFLQNLTVFDTVDSYLMFFLSLGFVASLQYQEKTGLAEEVRSIASKVSKGKIAKELAAKISQGGGRRLRWFEWMALGVVALICFCNFVVGPLRADYLTVATVKTKSLIMPNGQIVKKIDKPFGSDARLNSYRETLSASSMGRYQISDFFAQVFLDALEDKSQNIPEDQQVKEFVFLTDLLGQNIQTDPLDFKSRIILGDLYTFWGLIDDSKFALAESTLQDAIKLAPKDQEGYWNLAQTKLFEMRIDDALALANQALALEPDHPKSLTMIYQLQQLKQKLEKHPLNNSKSE